MYAFIIIYLFICLFIYLFIYLLIYVFIYLFIYQSNYLFIDVFIWLFLNLIMSLPFFLRLHFRAFLSAARNVNSTSLLALIWSLIQLWVVVIKSTSLRKFFFPLHLHKWKVLKVRWFHLCFLHFSFFLSFFLSLSFSFSPSLFLSIFPCFFSSSITYLILSQLHKL